MESGLILLAQISYWALTLYLWMIIVAVLLTWVAPDPRNPFVSFLNRMTAPLWNAMARVLPGRWRMFASYAALLAVMFAIEFVPGVLATLGGYAGGHFGADGLAVSIAGYFLRGVAEVLYNVCYFLILMLLVWFVLTLVSPSVGNPIVRLAYFMVDPIITPIQRVLPRMRVDVSPLIAAAILYVLNRYAVGALTGYAVSLTMVQVDPGLPIQRM